MSGPDETGSDDARVDGSGDGRLPTVARAHSVATFVVLAYASAWTIDFAVLAVGMEPS